MKRVVILTLIAVMALGVTLVAAPKIAVDNAVYDFGTVLEGVFVTHKFILSNVGDEPLTITNVRVACGCTATALSKTNLEPGESVELEASLDTLRYNGRISKSISVESNDPENARLTLRLTGVVTQQEPYHFPISTFNSWFYLLIDLRDPEAYAASHLMGAINIPLAELGDWVSRLPQGVVIILYDQDGMQGDLAAQVLNDKGFPDAKSLMGGFDEWVNVYKDKFTISTAAD
jgi:rhodanese-related sulfurtransferase